MWKRQDITFFYAMLLWTSLRFRKICKPFYCMVLSHSQTRHHVINISFHAFHQVIQCTYIQATLSMLVVYLFIVGHLPYGHWAVKFWTWLYCFDVVDVLLYILYEPQHEIFTNVVWATSKSSDQPALKRSLIRAFASRLNILWLLSYWQNIIWSF